MFTIFVNDMREEQIVPVKLLKRPCDVLGIPYIAPDVLTEVSIRMGQL